MKPIAKITLFAAAAGLPIAAYAAVHQDAEHDNDANEAAELARTPAPAISREQALQTASAIASGDVLDAEYERENGSWRWSFEFREIGRIHEIGIDGASGKVVEDSWESLEGDGD